MILPYIMKLKEESENVGLKLNIQKTNIMTSGPITSWQIEVEKVEAVTDFFIFSSKNTKSVTVDGECNHEVKDVCRLQGKLWQT